MTYSAALNEIAETVSETDTVSFINAVDVKNAFYVNGFSFYRGGIVYSNPQTRDG